MGYKIMKKKQISLILAVLVLGLSGCSSKETSEPVQETIEIESSSEIESSEEESSVIEEPTESTEPESESEEETIEVETTEAITEESSNDGVSESEPVQTVESVVEPVQSETPVVEVPVSEPVEIQSQAAETQPQQSTTSNGVTYNADGSISFYNSQYGYQAKAVLINPTLGIYEDQEGVAYNKYGQMVYRDTGELYTPPQMAESHLHDTYDWGDITLQ